MDECKGFLLEGYPANVEQAKAFEEEVKSHIDLYPGDPREISLLLLKVKSRRYLKVCYLFSRWKNIF